MTRVVGAHPLEEALAAASDVLLAAGVVAIPTETVYGLAALADDDAALQKIFEAKGRPSDNPLIVHVHDQAVAMQWWKLDARMEARAAALMAAFWPGPLTIVAPAASHVLTRVRAGLPSVGVRMPGHPFAHALLTRLQRPLAAPSANASGRPSPTTAAHVLRSLDGRIPLVIDGGACSHGLESSVVDVGGVEPRLLRRGSIDLHALRNVLPDVDVIGAREVGASPGLRHRHYAPLGKQLLWVEDVVVHWQQEVVIVARRSEVDRVRTTHGDALAHVIDMPDEPTAYARHLYRALHEAEQQPAATVVVHGVPSDDDWAAVADRLRRACEG
jgi:L-threonylcarbamoyladenylate synthase